MKVNEDQLRSVLRETILKAETGGGYDPFASGWGYPVYLKDNGEIYAGGLISNNSWDPSPDITLLCRVKAWNIDEHIPEDGFICDEYTRDDAINDYADDVEDYYIDLIKDNEFLDIEWE